MPCFSPLKGFRDPETGGLRFARSSSSELETLDVACGQCLGCRLDHARMWSMRIVHEASLYESGRGNCFVTLTYSDEFLPVDWSLDKSHFQKFMKRLRRSVDHHVRFFHVGEYGARCRHGDVSGCVCGVGRPHYHAILFNHRFDDLVLCGQRNSIPYYTSATLERLWGYGFVVIGEVTRESAGYVARYCLKKVTGVSAEEHYQVVDDDGVVARVAPEYCTMSRRPGIGREWFERYRSDVFPSDEVPVPGVGVVKSVPRYYEEIFGLEEPEVLEAVKARRQVFLAAHSADYTGDRLVSRYKVKKAAVRSLGRSL